MAKLPKPIITAKCGTCFQNLSWSMDLNTFVCTFCLTKVQPMHGGLFKSVYTDKAAAQCEQPPVESFKKIRHLRVNDRNEKFFVVFSYMFFPCSLPMGHTSPHYFHYSCRYSEETLKQEEITSKDIK